MLRAEEGDESGFTYFTDLLSKTVVAASQAYDASNGCGKQSQAFARGVGRCIEVCDRAVLTAKQDM